MNMETIRPATTEDVVNLKALYIDAFPKGEGEMVGEIAVALTEESADEDSLSIVIELDNEVIAHASFSSISCREKSNIVAYCLAPLAVKTALHKTGYGTKIVNYGVDLLKDRRADAVLVYGDPNYYGRFGFRHEIGKMFLVPYELEYALGWQGLLLSNLTITTPQQCTFTSVLSDQKHW